MKLEGTWPLLNIFIELKNVLIHPVYITINIVSNMFMNSNKFFFMKKIKEFYP